MSDAEEKIERIRRGRVTIVNGPDRMALSTALFDGVGIEFGLEGYRVGVYVILWGIECDDSCRRHWTFWGKIPGAGLEVKGSYWMCEGKREGEGYIEMRVKLI